MSNLASKIAGKHNATHDPLSELRVRLAGLAASPATSNAKLGGLVLATESYSDVQTQQLADAVGNIETQLRGAVAEALPGVKFKDFSMEAATIGALMSTAPKTAAMSKPRGLPSGAHMVNLGMSDTFSERPTFATESYDNLETRNTQMQTTLFNLLASRQDPFAEGFYPTIVCSPNDHGVTLSTSLFYLYNDFRRSTNGSLADFNRRNLLRAYTDTKMLNNQLTRCVPVYRDTGGDDDSTNIFVDPTVVPLWQEDLGGGVMVTTGALKVDTRIDKIGTSSTTELLANGVLGATDTLDAFCRLETLFVRVTDGTDTDVFSIDVRDLPASNFTYAVQGNTRRMQLVMDTNAVVLAAGMKQLNNTALTVLTELANHSARVTLTITGSMTLDTGSGIVQRGQLTLDALRNASGQLVTGAVFNALATKLASAEIIGYADHAYRSNTNLRQRGLLVDRQSDLSVIPVHWRAPISILSPVTSDGSEDQRNIDTLIAVTNMAINADAVNELLKDIEKSRAYRAIADATGTLPEMSAVGFKFLIPYFKEDNLDMALTVDSRVSHERFKDIRSAIVERLRFLANEMVIKSEYQTVGKALTGNPDFKPHVLVGVDQLTAAYLQTDGDLRLFGENLDVTVVSTAAESFRGKIVMTFMTDDSKRNSEVSPLNYGNFLYTPEVVLNMPLHLGGQTSRTLTVVPRYVRFRNLPVMTAVNISNLPAVTSKVTSNYHVV